MGSLCLKTTCIQFPSPLTPTSGYHKTDLFFYEFVYFRSIIDLKHYVSFRCTVQWFSVSVHYKMITTRSLLTMCPQLLQCDWLYPSWGAFHFNDYFVTGSVYPLISLTYFTHPFHVLILIFLIYGGFHFVTWYS